MSAEARELVEGDVPRLFWGERGGGKVRYQILPSPRHGERIECFDDTKKYGVEKPSLGGGGGGGGAGYFKVGVSEDSI